jgi:hypothetical protein
VESLFRDLGFRLTRLGGFGGFGAAGIANFLARAVARKNRQNANTSLSLAALARFSVPWR